MVEKTADRRDGTASPPSDAEIDQWLVGDDAATAAPLPIHRAQICAAEYQRATNTRWLARRQFLVGKDVGDDVLMSNARADARRARSLLELAVEGLREVWAELTPGQAEELAGQLPPELLAVVEDARDHAPTS